MLAGVVVLIQQAISQERVASSKRTRTSTGNARKHTHDNTHLLFARVLDGHTEARHGSTERRSGLEILFLALVGEHRHVQIRGCAC